MRHFLKVAELENVTQASLELHVAQPHLTRQIKSLEDELGVSLFTREKKRLHITDEGHFLKQQAEQILKLVEKTERQVKEMHAAMAGTLFLGAIETVGTALLPDWISEFSSKFSEVKYNIWSGNSKDVTERLEKGLLDLAVVREPFDSQKFDSIPLKDENWIVLISEEHILSQKSKDTLSLRELSGEPLLVPSQRLEEVQKWFSAEGYTANIRCGFSPLLNGIVLAEKNLGIAVVPELARKSAANRKLIIKTIEDNCQTRVALIWRKNTELPTVAKKFIDLISEI